MGLGVDSGELHSVEHAAEGPRLATAGEPTMIEHAFPYQELSMLARADRRMQDPAHGTHRWWARRPPAVFRGILLAAAFARDVDPMTFWDSFASPGSTLSGLRIHDAFAGGGTTLVEAARLGADPSGSDIDPLAVAIVRQALTPAPELDVRQAADELLARLEGVAAGLYPAADPDWTPLHYFYLHNVTCPGCKVTSALYRNLVIARDSKKSGSVRREYGTIAFCPTCFKIHSFADSYQTFLECCGSRYELTFSNFASAVFTCPHCGHHAGHKDLRTGLAPRRLIAVEETHLKRHRRIRAPLTVDHEADLKASEYVKAHRGRLLLPTARFSRVRHDPRPVSFGITRFAQLFTSRQLVVFGQAFKWLQRAERTPAVRRALTLGISNALSTNNRLCSYATDYGRLAPLFSVRSFALPALTVELNPLHASAGRGTLRRSIDHVTKASALQMRRHVWSAVNGAPVATTISLEHRRIGGSVRTASAAVRRRATEQVVDLCIFDPPYFDYISYSELSKFYRAWLERLTMSDDLPSAPLLPDAGAPESSFGKAFGRCLSAISTRLALGRPMVFTFHSATQPAWQAIGHAIDHADLLITALWPVWNDSHMGHHSSEGNCEWDLVLVCRRSDECRRTKHRMSIDRWLNSLAPLSVSAADRANLTYAMEMSKSRWGEL